MQSTVCRRLSAVAKAMDEMESAEAGQCNQVWQAFLGLDENNPLVLNPNARFPVDPQPYQVWRERLP